MKCENGCLHSYTLPAAFKDKALRGCLASCIAGNPYCTYRFLFCPPGWTGNTGYRDGTGCAEHRAGPCSHMAHNGFTHCTMCYDILSGTVSRRCLILLEYATTLPVNQLEAPGISVHNVAIRPPVQDSAVPRCILRAVSNVPMLEAF